jgi:flagellar biosynthesis anti-sigma factor FlgM
MQITALHAHGSPRASGGTVQDPAANASRGVPAGADNHDQVSLSESARSLAAAYRVVDGTPWVREDTVRSVRSALTGGGYAIDVRDIAARMSA